MFHSKKGKGGEVNVTNNTRARSFGFLPVFCCFGIFAVLTRLVLGLPKSRVTLTLS